MKAGERAISIVGLLGRIQPAREDPGCVRLLLGDSSQAFLHSLRIDSSGRHLVCLDSSLHLYVFDCKFRKFNLLTKLKPASVWSLAQSSSIRATVLIGHSDGQVQVFRNASGIFKAEMVAPVARQIVATAQNVHRNLYLFADCTTVVLLDSKSLKTKATLLAEGDKFISAGFTPDSQGIITMSAKGYFAIRLISNFQLLDYMHIGRKVGKGGSFLSRRENDSVVYVDCSNSLFIYDVVEKRSFSYEFESRVVGAELVDRQRLVLLLDSNQLVEWSVGEEGGLLLLGFKEGLAGMAYCPEEGLLCVGSRQSQIRVFKYQKLREEGSRLNFPCKLVK